MKRKLIGTTLAGLVAMSAAVFGTAGPALAASRSDGCLDWACGSATFSFDGNYRVRPITMNILDPLCNGSNAYIRFRVHYVDGSSWTGPKRYDTTGGSACDKKYKGYPDLAFGPSDKLIRGAQVLLGDGVNGVRGGSFVKHPDR